jgi:ribosome-associated heat shock protein Hsp15
VIIGDVITIEKIPYQFTITVLGLNDQRRPASEAELLYVESEQSIETRHLLRQRLRNDALAHAGIAGEGRPSKKQRRQIIRFQNQKDQQLGETNDSDTDH